MRIFHTIIQPLFILLLLCICIASCKNEVTTTINEEKINEGRITYSVTFPDIPANSLAHGMLPNEMTLSFKGSKTMIEVGTMLFSLRKILDSDKKEAIAMLSTSGMPSLAYKITGEELEELISVIPQYEITIQDETKKIAETEGIKAKAKELTTGSTMEFYCSKNPMGDNLNWCSPFEEVQGVLLEYDYQEGNFPKMRLKVTKIEHIAIDDKTFEYDKEDFNWIDKEKFEEKIKTFSNIMSM